MPVRSYSGDLTGALGKLQRRITVCCACPRLQEYRERMARDKKPKYAQWDYWGAPVPSYGDPEGRLLILGLAPASHGANRTGRLFTGDSTADFLIAALYRAGFANQPTSQHRDDGFKLIDAYEVAAVRCAPPNDKPTGEEQRTCRTFLEEELGLLPNIRVVLALGRIAFDNYVRTLNDQRLGSSRLRFSHGALYDLGSKLPTLIASYHPSPRNTNTGRLTVERFDQIMADVRCSIERNSRFK